MENKRLPTTEHSWKFVKIEKSSLSTVWLRRQDFSEYERKNEVEYLVENLFYEDNSFINNCNFAFFCAILKNRISVFMILPYCLLKGIVSGDFQPLFNLKKSSWAHNEPAKFCSRIFSILRGYLSKFVCPQSLWLDADMRISNFQIKYIREIEKYLVNCLNCTHR